MGAQVGLKAIAKAPSLQDEYSMTAMSKVKYAATEHGGLPSKAEGKKPSMIEILMSSVVDRSGLPVNPASLHAVLLAKPGKSRVDMPHILARAVLKDVNMVSGWWVEPCFHLSRTAHTGLELDSLYAEAHP